MAYQDKKQSYNIRQDKKARPEEQFVPEQSSFRMPNSFMMSAPVPPPGTPNSVMREMLDPQIPEAEAEADRLSAGINSGTLNSVRREMGNRLGSDFSSVHFHTDSNSIRRNEFMGSRAYTRGNNIYFGRDGFQPSVAAHELVHTVQQGAVPGRAAMSVPFGTVQRDPDDSPLGKFKRAVRKVIIINRFTKALQTGKQNKGANPGSEAGIGEIPQSGQASDDHSIVPSGGSSSINPPVSSVPISTQSDNIALNDDAGSSTQSKKIITQPFNGLSVMVDGVWTGAKEAETMVKNARKEADRNRGTVSTTEYEEPDPDIQPRPENGGEVVRDSDTGLWVEKAGRDLFVYIDGHWLAAMERRPASSSGEDIDQDPRTLSKNLLERDDSSVNDEERSESESESEGERIQQDGSSANALPDPNRIFGTGRRWRMSRTALTDEQIDGMVALFKDYSRRHHPDKVFPTSAKIVAGPIQSGLRAANDVVERASGSGHQEDETSSPSSSPSLSASPSPALQLDGNGSDSAPDPDAEQVPGILPGPSHYRALGSGWKKSKEHTANAAAVQNVGMGANAFGRQGVLLNNYRYHVSQDAKDKLPIWDESKWKLPTSGKDVKDSSGNVVSQGKYDPYVDYVAPIAGTALGVYGTATGFTSMVHGINDTVRHHNNVAAGASRWDAAQSGLDTVAAASSTMSSVWGTVQSIGNIGGAATSTFGDAVHALPGLSIVTGAANAISGTSQAIRGRKTRSELNAAGRALDQIAFQQEMNGDGRSEDPGQMTDQDKLRAIMKQGHQTAVFNMWSGGLKAAAGGLTAAAGVSSLVGAAPVAAGIQGVVAVLNLAKFIFERAYKSKMRNSIVAQEFDIDWKQEMQDVRAMIAEHNPKFGIRDKDVRRIILKAHGSNDATRTAAYNTIKLNRARYLINTATDANNAFHRVAEMVIEAMGVHKRGGNNYAAGADRLLAEKLG